VTIDGFWSQSQSQSYVTTDGQSASLSWFQAPISGPRPNFYYCHTVAGLLMWGAVSDERTDLSFTIAAGPRHTVLLWFESRGTHDCNLLSQIRDSPNLEGQVHIFTSPRNRVAQLYPQALCSLVISSYDSRDCGGVIVTLLNVGRFWITPE
jgi:hypothetical protein